MFPRQSTSSTVPASARGVREKWRRRQCLRRLQTRYSMRSGVRMRSAPFMPDKMLAALKQTNKRAGDSSNALLNPGGLALAMLHHPFLTPTSRELPAWRRYCRMRQKRSHDRVGYHTSIWREGRKLNFSCCINRDRFAGTEALPDSEPAKVATI